MTTNLSLDSILDFLPCLQPVEMLRLSHEVQFFLSRSRKVVSGGVSYSLVVHNDYFYLQKTVNGRRFRVYVGVNPNDRRLEWAVNRIRNKISAGCRANGGFSDD